MGVIDLHIHTEFSDGMLKISEIDEFAKKNDIKCISITDHDTIAGYEKYIQEFSNNSDLKMISGIEVTAMYGDKEIHLLCYGMDIQDAAFQKLITIINVSFSVQVIRVMKYLKNYGYCIADESTWIEKGIGSLAQYCVDMKYFKDTKSFYSSVLGLDGSRHNKRKKPHAKEVIQSVVQAGGIVSLAHPIRISDDLLEVEKAINELKSYGLSGLECFHPLQSQNFTDYLDMAEKNGLYVTGGSDFHNSLNDDYIVGKLKYKWCGKSFVQDISEYCILL